MNALITASTKDNPPILSQNIIDDTVCLRVARPDIQNAKVTTIDTDVDNATNKASAKSIRKIKCTSKKNTKGADSSSNKVALGISDSSDSDSDK